MGIKKESWKRKSRFELSDHSDTNVSFPGSVLIESSLLPSVSKFILVVISRGLNMHHVSVSTVSLNQREQLKTLEDTWMENCFVCPFYAFLDYRLCCRTVSVLHNCRYCDSEKYSFAWNRTYNTPLPLPTMWRRQPDIHSRIKRKFNTCVLLKEKREKYKYPLSLWGPSVPSRQQDTNPDPCKLQMSHVEKETLWLQVNAIIS